MKKVTKWIARNLEGVALWILAIATVLSLGLLVLRVTNIVDLGFWDIVKPITIPSTILGLLFAGYGYLYLLAIVGEWARKKIE